MKEEKAPGTDVIDVTIIKKAYLIIEGELLIIMNACLTFGLFPKE